MLRSELFAHFSEAIFGTATLRAYGVQRHSSKEIRDSVDNLNRNSRIIICDDATSSVDFEIDAKTQKTNAEMFRLCCALLIGSKQYLAMTAFA